MPNQAKVITIVNRRLEKLPNIEFEFNKAGICSGLAGLSIKHALENKTYEFFRKKDLLSQLPENYKFGENKYAENFIAEIEEAFTPAKYYKGEVVIQGDFDRVLTIKGEPLRNEFNIGLITDKNGWSTILDSISRSDRGYWIASTDHAVAMWIKNGKYYVYDPNYDDEDNEEEFFDKVKIFESPLDVIIELKKCFNYDEDYFPMMIRAFANPGDIPCNNYPSQNTLLQHIFKTEKDLTRSFTNDEGAVFTSQTMASWARDEHTLNYIFDTKVIDFKNITHHQARYNHFLKLLLEQPKSNDLKNALLTAIDINIYWGFYIQNTMRLIKHYNTIFKEQNDKVKLVFFLKNCFNRITMDHLRAMNIKEDYSDIVHLCEEYNLTIDESNNPSNIYHFLKALSLYNTGSEELNEYIENIFPEQIIKQISYAAKLNHVELLNYLLKNSLKNTKLANLIKNGDIFDVELIKYINTNTLNILFEAGIKPNPALISECLKRKDKAILSQYVNAILKSDNNKFLLNQFANHFKDTLNLNYKIGNIDLLTVLAYLDEKDSIFKLENWDNIIISPDSIESALKHAIKLGSIDISSFLHTKLGRRMSDTVINNLVEHAIETENNTILTLISNLGYNILSLQNFYEIIDICKSNNDYTALKNFIKLADTNIINDLLKLALLSTSKLAFKVFAKYAPEDLTNMLASNIKRGKFYSQINQCINLPAMHDVRTDLINRLKPTMSNEFIHYCYNNELLNLAAAFSDVIEISNLDLNKILIDLIDSNNEAGIIVLLEKHPNAQLTEDILNQLVDQLLEKSIINNNSKIVALILDQLLKNELILPEDSLSKLLKRAIDANNTAIFELFCNRKENLGIDFKDLFLYSCTKGKPSIANQLLVKPIQITNVERLILFKLFGAKPSSDFFDEIYHNGYARLYVYLMKMQDTKFTHMKSDLLHSVKEAYLDPRMEKAKSKIMYSLIQRAINEKDENLLKEFLSQAKLPEHPNKDIVDLIEKNPTPNLIKLIKEETKYTAKDLLKAALNNKSFLSVAIIIEENGLHDFDKDEIKILQQYNQPIINTFVTHLTSISDKFDVRPRLFNLLEPPSTSLPPPFIKHNQKFIYSTSPDGLNILAKPYIKWVHKNIVEVELDMIKQNRDLNGKIYRHKSESNLYNLSLELDTLQTYIYDKKIDLNSIIKNKTVSDSFIQIKKFISEHNVGLSELGDNNYDLLTQLNLNFKFKELCQNISEEVCYQLDVEKDGWKLISDSMKEKIKHEITELLYGSIHTLNQTQKSILLDVGNTILSENYSQNDIIAEIAGEFKTDDDFNITLDTGYQCNGLSGMYFKSISIRSLIDRGLEYFPNFSGSDPDIKVMASDIFSNDKNLRKKLVMLWLFKRIAAHASLDQLIFLQNKIDTCPFNDEHTKDYSKFLEDRKSLIIHLENFESLKFGYLDNQSKEDIFAEIKKLSKDKQVLILQLCLNKSTPLGTRFFKQEENELTPCSLEKGILKEIHAYSRMLDRRSKQPTTISVAKANTSRFEISPNRPDNKNDPDKSEKKRDPRNM